MMGGKSIQCILFFVCLFLSFCRISLMIKFLKMSDFVMCKNQMNRFVPNHVDTLLIYK